MKQNKIGITGSIASGKSVLTAYLLGLGFPVIDADAIARDLVHPGSETLKKIAEIFGEDMIQSDGNLDRDKLGKRVFTDEDARNRLNEIMHPAIVGAMLDLSENFHGLVFYDVPLLFEQIDDIKKTAWTSTPSGSWTPTRTCSSPASWPGTILTKPTPRKKSPRKCPSRKRKSWPPWSSTIPAI